MKTRLLASVALVALAVPALAQSQADHQQHHPGGTSAPQTQVQPQATPPAALTQSQSQTPAAPGQPQSQMPMGQMMQNMPEQCRTMMQNMPPGCMGMMQQTMQGGMRGGMMQGQLAQGPSSQAGSQSESTKSYKAAMDEMHGPMLQGIQDGDPDVAFVKGMIPHHQGAIDMAKVVLQYGKDDQAKKWANVVIRDQGREIAEMQDWLMRHSK